MRLTTLFRLQKVDFQLRKTYKHFAIPAIVAKVILYMIKRIGEGKHFYPPHLSPNPHEAAPIQPFTLVYRTRLKWSSTPEQRILKAEPTYEPKKLTEFLFETSGFLIYPHLLHIR